MGKYSTPKELFTAICDSIRNKTGKTDLINHEDIPSEIDSIVVNTGKPYIDSVRIEHWNYFFEGGENTDILDDVDFSGGVYFNYTFKNFYSSNIKVLPSLNMRNGLYFTQCFNHSGVQEIQEIILNNAETSHMDNMFYNSKELEKVKINGTIKVNSNDLNLSDCTLLDADSLLSFINAFKNNSSGSTTYTVYFGTANLEKLTTEQKQIAINKNITLA